MKAKTKRVPYKRTPWVAKVGIVRDSRSYPVCLLVHPDHDTPEVAQLLAAAPRLLKALEDVLRIADRDTDIFNEARAAVRQARGE